MLLEAVANLMETRKCSLSDEKMSLAAAAQQLGLPYSTVWLYWSQGKIAYERYGATIVVKLSHVEKAMAGRKPKNRRTPVVVA